jgi:hypothetical protein
MKTQVISARMIVEVEGGIVRRIYGEHLPDHVQIEFIVDDLDDRMWADDGEKSPVPTDIGATIGYW